MNTKSLALSAMTLAASAFAVPAHAITNAPVPTANYIVFGGNDWAWASPCPPSGGFSEITCGTGESIDFSFQGTLGWRLPTTAELLAGPSVSDFGPSNNFACAAAWFTNYSNCDHGDAAGGAVFGSPGGDVWYAETWAIRGGAVPEPATWAMLIAGFGLVGAAMRRRHAHASRVAA